MIFLPAELQPCIAADLAAGEGDAERGGQAAAMGIDGKTLCCRYTRRQTGATVGAQWPAIAFWLIE